MDGTVDGGSPADAMAADASIDGSAADAEPDGAGSDVGVAPADAADLDASELDADRLDADTLDAAGLDAFAADAGLDAFTTDVGLDAFTPDVGTDASMADASAPDAATPPATCEMTGYTIDRGILDVTSCGTLSLTSGSIFTTTGGTAASVPGPCVTRGSDDPTARTIQLRDAMELARRNNWALYFPPGMYAVTPTDSTGVALDCLQESSGMGAGRYGRLHPCIIVGSACGESRLTLTGTANDMTLLRVASRTTTGALDFNDSYNHVVRRLTLDTMPVTGLRPTALAARSAEGTSIHDIRIFSAAGGTGVSGVPGSGGSIVNLEVQGGRVGINATTSQPGATVFAATLSGQTAAALVLGTAGSQGSMTLVGVRITDFRGTNAIVGTTGSSPAAASRMLVLVDTTIEFATYAGTNTAVNIGRSVFLDDVWTRNAGVVVAHATPLSTSAAVGAWSFVDRAARAVDPVIPMDMALVGPTMTSRIWTCTTATCPSSSTVTALSGSTPGGTPPADLAGIETRHGWPGGAASADFERSDREWVSPDGADDRAAIQAAIDRAGSRPVILEQGLYVLSGPVTLAASTRLIGLGSTSSVLTPDGTATSFASAGRCSTLDAEECPLVTTLDASAGTSELSYVGLYLDNTVGGGAVTGANAYLLDWRSGPMSLVRGIFANLNSSGAAFLPPIDGPVLHFQGGGRAYGLFAVQNSVPRGVGFRAFTVDAPTGGPRALRFYHVVPSHAGTAAAGGAGVAMEIAGASDVHLYGLKFESEPDDEGGTMIWAHDATDLRIYGSDGNGTPGPAALQGIVRLERVSRVDVACMTEALDNAFHVLAVRVPIDIPAARAQLSRATVTTDRGATPIAEVPAWVHLD